MKFIKKIEQYEETIATGDFDTAHICDFGGVVEGGNLACSFEYLGKLLFTRATTKDNRITVNIAITANQIDITGEIETDEDITNCIVSFTKEELNALSGYILNCAKGENKS